MNENLFDQRFDENGRLLQIHHQQDNNMQLSDDDQIRLFVEQTTELFKKERGRAIAKKNNYGDTISTRVETSVIIQ